MQNPDSHALDITNWLLGEAMGLELPAIIEGLAHRLVVTGMRVDRFMVSFSLLNPSLIAGGIIWRPERELEFSRYTYISRNSGMYERSPFKAALDQGGGWLEIDLDATPDDAYGIVPDLKAEGLKHYIVIPMPSPMGRQMNITMATTLPEGFSAAQKNFLLEILPAIRATVDLKSLNVILRDVLSAYVGRVPAREIVSGTVHRGETRELRAAILVADLRGFTSISTQLPVAATAEVINRYYDVVVPPIEQHGGEILKFIGDAVLAIFPAAQSGEDAAVLAALDAAAQALTTVVDPYELGDVVAPIRFGIAIHVGDAAYGNVGSGDRLDFTVIGRDVNIAARIASLCSRLGRDYLVSEPVAEIGRRHGRSMLSAGAHDVRGIRRPVPVYVPDAELLEPESDDGISQGLVLVSPA
ncbi:adenylate/guanylate cyclase domain-containing protein [Acuticoccus sp. I52.16.1]|uniref:adenylate/guanylate cyclase domain-containing protein n=1 Tax=Acuticoccus sp. I52.16.1 TaxID=2928472 RepID=UPI001FD4D814|nr:adenylate/guanylate cyclase domain-containing protein [Acuticoccus sp. I52.16.1]UOM33089.1 adenylate/guanylate cyclase domain-containing protein [Acuticoccus sp. I52.16.1]